MSGTSDVAGALQVLSRLLTTLSTTIEHAEMAVTDGYRQELVDQAALEAAAVSAALGDLDDILLQRGMLAADHPGHESRGQGRAGRRDRRSPSGLRRVAARISRARL
jgi:hypothetical protein